MSLPATAVSDPLAQLNFEYLGGSAPTFVGTAGAVPFGAGWTNYGGFLGACYWKTGGMVHLAGLVTKTGGTPTLGDAIFVLPRNLWPSAPEVFVVTTGEAAGFGRVDVNASGQVLWRGGPAAEIDFTSLSTIRFWVG